MMKLLNSNNIDHTKFYPEEAAASPAGGEEEEKDRLSNEILTKFAS